MSTPEVAAKSGPASPSQDAQVTGLTARDILTPRQIARLEADLEKQTFEPTGAFEPWAFSGQTPSGTIRYIKKEFSKRGQKLKIFMAQCRLGLH